MKNKILVKTMALGLSFAMAFGQPLTVFSQEADPSVAAADMVEKAGIMIGRRFLKAARVKK